MYSLPIGAIQLAVITFHFLSCVNSHHSLYTSSVKPFWQKY
uniref:Uncharacterized protein n=1 Tax=Anguilla anguilla TaxID=7936 RepID=A0A0E9T7M4_ANGAN